MALGDYSTTNFRKFFRKLGEVNEILSKSSDDIKRALSAAITKVLLRKERILNKVKEGTLQAGEVNRLGAHLQKLLKYAEDVVEKGGEYEAASAQASFKGVKNDFKKFMGGWK